MKASQPDSLFKRRTFHPWIPVSQSREAASLA